MIGIWMWGEGRGKERENDKEWKYEVFTLSDCRLVLSFKISLLVSLLWEEV
jgi:hypothetical protein